MRLKVVVTIEKIRASEDHMILKFGLLTFMFFEMGLLLGAR
jgi:hypothetical protein